MGVILNDRGFCAHGCELPPDETCSCGQKQGMTTYLINLTENFAVCVTHQRNFLFADLERALGHRFQRIAGDLADDFANIPVSATFTEESPELAGIWFDSFQKPPAPN